MAGFVLAPATPMQTCFYSKPDIPTIQLGICLHSLESILESPNHPSLGLSMLSIVW